MKSVIALAFSVPPTFLRVPWRGLKGEATVIANQEIFLYFLALKCEEAGWESTPYHL